MYQNSVLFVRLLHDDLYSLHGVSQLSHLEYMDGSIYLTHGDGIPLLHEDLYSEYDVSCASDLDHMEDEVFHSIYNWFECQLLIYYQYHTNH